MDLSWAYVWKHMDVKGRNHAVPNRPFCTGIFCDLYVDLQYCGLRFSSNYPLPNTELPWLLNCCRAGLSQSKETQHRANQSRPFSDVQCWGDKAMPNILSMKKVQAPWKCWQMCWGWYRKLLSHMLWSVSSTKVPSCKRYTLDRFIHVLHLGTFEWRGCTTGPSQCWLPDYEISLSLDRLVLFSSARGSLQRVVEVAVPWRAACSNKGQRRNEAGGRPCLEGREIQSGSSRVWNHALLHSTASFLDVVSSEMQSEKGVTFGHW